MDLVLVSERSVEFRSAVRYKLLLPVIFHWDDGSEHTEGGFTQDVALNGAFILSSRCPPVGGDVRIEVLLQSPDELGGILRIQCVGKVTHVIGNIERIGFGVRGTFDYDHLTL